MSKIDLGQKWEEMTAPLESVMKETHYPTLHIDEVDDKRLAEMPTTGTMTIHYKIKNRTHSERDIKGKKKHACSVTLDVTHIDPPACKKKSGDSDGGARKALTDYFKDK